MNNGNELCALSAQEMVDRLKRREVSAVELLDAHLAQIERFNPSVNAVITLEQDRARADAVAADQKTISGRPLGLLHGLPMAHKDTHRTKGIRTTFGSPLYVDNVPEADDLIIERLHDAGVITIGKTNTPEFAVGSHTFNRVFGSTNNPYDLTCSAGGSSGGGAVGLALGMHPLADGSDMGGSLRNPASFCNVVGLRPSFGRVPNFPSNVSNERLSVPGAMARSVGDIGLIMQAIAGPDARDQRSLDEPGDIFAAPLRDDIVKKRVAWAPDLGGLIAVDPEVGFALSHCPKIFSDLGWELTDDLPDLSGADETFRVLRAVQFAESYGTIVDQSPEMVKETIHWNVAVGRSLSPEQVERAVDHQQLIIEKMRRFFAGVDLLALPVAQVAPFPIELEYPKVIDGHEVADYLGWMASCYLISVTELPAIALPAGFTSRGLPVGLQLVGPPHGDVALLQAAYHFEQATKIAERRPPMLDAD